jgi:outer membrane lipoprotein SlyB
MKKLVITFLTLAMMAILVPLATNAQTRNNKCFNRNSSSRQYTNRDVNSRQYQQKSLYQRHRNLINIGIGTGAGTLLGALIGGKKGALIGAAAGAGGSALYTYKINPKNKRYYRRP